MKTKTLLIGSAAFLASAMLPLAGFGATLTTQSNWVVVFINKLPYPVQVVSAPNPEIKGLQNTPYDLSFSYMAAPPSLDSGISTSNSFIYQYGYTGNSSQNFSLSEVLTVEYQIGGQDKECTLTFENNNLTTVLYGYLNNGKPVYEIPANIGGVTSAYGSNNCDFLVLEKNGRVVLSTHY